jgi:hypothetical protein
MRRELARGDLISKLPGVSKGSLEELQGNSVGGGKKVFATQKAKKTATGPSASHRRFCMG